MSVDRPPELAYSWPALIFAAALVDIVALCIWSGDTLRLVGIALLGFAFACCPLRDWLLNRYYPPDETGWNRPR
jgi:hypothetical protein